MLGGAILSCMTTATKSDWIPRDDLATRVVVLRTQMGLSRRQFAQLTGLTENQLQGIEDGRSPHKLPEKIQAIHNATGVSREWLMWGGPLNGDGPHQGGPGGGGECPQSVSIRRPADYKGDVLAFPVRQRGRESDYAVREVAA